jgi:DNA mismatch endonuclease (patch repair protein)
MADIVSRETRSRMMSGIRGADTKPELEVRRYLFARGFRYRLHVRGLPGRPDLVITSLRTALFVNGCFWHRHVGCRFAYTPKSRTGFWLAKLEANAVRDRRNHERLRELGWTVLVVWECEISPSYLAALADDIGANT